jgi:predicted HTH domain antitoxin
MPTIKKRPVKTAIARGIQTGHEQIKPDAVMIGLQSGKLLSEPGARAALATALFRDGGLSLARGARMAQMPMADFITHVSRLGIPVITHDAHEVTRDMDTLDQWLATS